MVWLQFRGTISITTYYYTGDTKDVDGERDREREREEAIKAKSEWLSSIFLRFSLFPPTDLFPGVDPLSEHHGAVGAVPQLLQRPVSVHHLEAGLAPLAPRMLVLVGKI